MKNHSGSRPRESQVCVKLASAIGTVLVGCGIIGLVSVGMVGAGSTKLIAGFNSAPSRGLPIGPAAGGAMFVSGAIVLFSGRNRIS